MSRPASGPARITGSAAALCFALALPLLTRSTAARAEPRPGLRVGLVYAPGVLLGDTSRTEQPGDLLHGLAGGAHNLGAELSLGRSYFRYHLTAAFAVAGGAGGGTGFRLEPATLGVAVPVLERARWRLEVEPTAMVVNVSYLGAADAPGSIVALSSGADLRANLAFGRLFVAASPLGFEVRYAAIDASQAKSHAFSGSAVTYRLRVFVGAEF